MKKILNHKEMIDYLNQTCPWGQNRSKSALLNNVLNENDSYELTRINLNQPKIQSSLFFKPHSKKNLRKYISLIKNNQKAPPVVLKENNENYSILDGNHRIHAAISCQEEFIWAYVLR